MTLSPIQKLCFLSGILLLTFGFLSASDSLTLKISVGLPNGNPSYGEAEVRINGKLAPCDSATAMYALDLPVYQTCTVEVLAPGAETAKFLWYNQYIQAPSTCLLVMLSEPGCFYIRERYTVRSYRLDRLRLGLVKQLAPDLSWQDTPALHTLLDSIGLVIEPVFAPLFPEDNLDSRLAPGWLILSRKDGRSIDEGSINVFTELQNAGYTPGIFMFTAEEALDCWPLYVRFFDRPYNMEDWAAQYGMTSKPYDDNYSIQLFPNNIPKSPEVWLNLLVLISQDKKVASINLERWSVSGWDD